MPWQRIRSGNNTNRRFAHFGPIGFWLQNHRRCKKMSVTRSFGFWTEVARETEKAARQWLKRWLVKERGGECSVSSAQVRNWRTCLRESLRITIPKRKLLLSTNFMRQ